MIDEMLARIAGKAGGIKPLLDTFFSFLERKTDFYVQFDPSDKSKGPYKMGFPTGNAEKMVVQSFRQYKLKDYDAVVGANASPSTPSKVPVVNSSSNLPQSATKNSVSVTSTSRAPPSTPPKSLSPRPPPVTPTTTKGSAAMTPSYTPEGKQIPIGNGGIEERYYWTQTLRDVTVYIDAPLGTRSKDVKCTIKPQSLHVAIHGAVVLDGQLEDVIKAGESLWTISSGSAEAAPQIVLTLDKTRQTWWKHVLAGHEEIDTNKVRLH